MVFGRIASIGLDQRNFGKHSLHRTKAALIYRRTGNLHAVQLLLGQILALTRTNDKRGCGGSAWAPLYSRFCRYRLLFEPDVLHARTVEDAVDHKGQPVYPRVPAGPIADGDHAGPPLVLARTAPKEAGSTSDN
jgi:hypothetical protein